MSGGDFCNAGAPADLVTHYTEVVDDLIKQGKVVGSRLDFARAGVGVAVNAGAPKPDVGTPEAFKRAMLARQVDSLFAHRRQRHHRGEADGTAGHRRAIEGQNHAFLLASVRHFPPNTYASFLSSKNAVKCSSVGV